MWIHIPSNETGWELLNIGKNRSCKQEKVNLQGHTCADQEVTTLNGESAKGLLLGEMWNLARDWFYETFLQAIAGDNCSASQLLAWLLWARFCISLPWSSIFDQLALMVSFTGFCNRPSNPHGLTVRLTVWDANSRSHGFAS